MVEDAAAVLDRNWFGLATRPGPHLYPHQWSWDSAFVAIGLAHVRPERAPTELRSLFRGQWRTGLLPHIVFTPGLPHSVYFPSADFWDTTRSSDAPAEPATSGVVQPPAHAIAAWHVHRHASDSAESEAFLRDLFPKLRAWHDYLYRERDPGGDGLVAIRHPWESGEDNSPMWDDPLSRIAVPSGAMPSYPRVDLRQVDDDQRPTMADYDHFLYLVERMKERNYDEAKLRDDHPFLVAEPLFNALLVRAGEDLAEIAAAIGSDPAPFREQAARTAAALDAGLWDDARGLYVPFDLVAGRQIAAAAAAGLTPLFAGVPDPARADRMVDTLTSARFWAPERGGRPVPSYDRLDRKFSPRRYWRGPVWINIDWLLYHGLLRYGYAEHAQRLRDGILALVSRAGFHEYFDPDTGEGYGSDDFAWTAALVLDLLLDRA